MKRLLLACLIALSGVLSSSAVRYQGFVETSYGVFAPSKYFKSGPELGFSTSHGVEIEPGIFVGIGLDWLFGGYKEPDNNSDYDFAYYQNMFVEGRYSLYPNKKITPFVGLRFGAGLGGYEGGGSLLHPCISPAVGCSFNFSQRCGIDVGIGYVFRGTESVTTIPVGSVYSSYSSSTIKVVSSS